MALEQQVYKCSQCGNMLELVHFGGGPLTCCGQPMNLQEENSTEAATEKHIPEVSKVDGGYKVVVGSVAHPMEEKHYIEWIELIVDETLVLRKHLKPGDPPEALFKTGGGNIKARAYCNLHGLWIS
jgi:superoxide reductase